MARAKGMAREYQRDAKVGDSMFCCCIGWLRNVQSFKMHVPFCMISYQDKFLSQWQDFNKNYPCHTRPNFFCNLPLPCVSVTFSREFPFVAKTYTCHLLPCLISHHNNSTIYATWSLNIVECISWEKIPYVNHSNPKIWLLIVPSSCYTFPCK